MTCTSNLIYSVSLAHETKWDPTSNTAPPSPANLSPLALGACNHLLFSLLAPSCGFGLCRFFHFPVSASSTSFFPASPGLNNLDAAVPLVPVLAETPSIDKAVTLPPTTSRHKRPQETKHRSSPTPKKEVIAWRLFLKAAKDSQHQIIVIVAGGPEARYLSTSTDFSPLTPAVCTACQDLLQCGELPSSHQNKPPFFGSPAQSPADSEEKTLRFN
ncbi:uncharacterized protein TrAtP1_008132 [Trichoderma atroviride]|uniref:uncharacterized protein n=1 Tax=Hypocrea atroviridis TaxID=63577 RepID=UPI003323747A|nr:hypothetical protein TrAtP1_008132 [Trichoderma atroviride]